MVQSRATEVGGGADGQLPELAGGWTRHRAVSSAGGYRDYGRAPGGPVAPVKSRAGSLVRGQPHGTFSELYVDAFKALRNQITVARQRAASTPA